MKLEFSVQESSKPRDRGGPACSAGWGGVSPSVCFVWAGQTSSLMTYRRRERIASEHPVGPVMAVQNVFDEGRSRTMSSQGALAMSSRISEDGISPGGMISLKLYSSGLILFLPFNLFMFEYALLSRAVLHRYISRREVCRLLQLRPRLSDLGALR